MKNCLISAQIAAHWGSSSRRADGTWGKKLRLNKEMRNSQSVVCINREEGIRTSNTNPQGIEGNSEGEQNDQNNSAEPDISAAVVGRSGTTGAHLTSGKKC